MSNVKPYDLLRKGGDWLGALRNWIKWNVHGGDCVTWGSDQSIPMTVVKLEEAGAYVAAKVMNDYSAALEGAVRALEAAKRSHAPDRCIWFAEDRHSPDPKTLYADSEPVSARNDAYVLAAAARCDFHLCAWGNHGAYLARGARMKRMLLDSGFQLYVLGLTKDGYPIHPLARGKMRVPDDAQPLPWAGEP